MAKKKTVKINQGTIWLLIIIIISIVGAFPQVAVGMNTYYIYLILALGGAVIAILNIRKKEEINFLIAATAFIVVTVLGIYNILTDLTTNGIIDIASMGILSQLLLNLIFAFAVAGFIVALGKIIKISVD